ncbi:MAG: cation-translocating P-type ATPase [Coriobacteriia bacterium]|nr:cation-translocating P-type ATPase [Coriobacteriia bacterium]MCL2536773.1 cation-translocating P-type ATPase [Coriobacteriia bacterium]
MTRWYQLDRTEALTKIGSDATTGLSSDEARRRLEKYGPNQLNEAPATPLWKVFVLQFKDFLIYILLAAVLIAALQGQIIEAIAILIILIVNGILGFVQEYRSGKALEALKQMAAPMAYVMRDGRQQHLLSSQLVPGDIVMLEAGNTVPADGRLIDAAALQINESALTGESEQVRKTADTLTGDHDILGDQESMVFASTTVSAGRGTLVVTSTGQSTEMGKIATLLDSTQQGDSPLQIEIERTGKHIGIAILVIAAIIFVQGILAGSLPLLTDASSSLSLGQLLADPGFRAILTSTMLVAIALAVAAIPEGLPAIVTVTLSLGVRRMAARHAIMKRLHAVETLGSTTYICSDKTGTLTQNVMTVKRLVLGTQVLRVHGSELGVLPRASELTEAASTKAEECVHTSSPCSPVQELLDARIVNEAALKTLLSIASSCNDAHYTAGGELVGDPTETALVACVRDLMPDLQSQLPPRVSEIPFDSDRKRMSVILDDSSAGLPRYITFAKGGFDTLIPCCTHALVDGHIVALDDALLAQLSAENERFASEGLRTLAFALREDTALPQRDDDVAGIESRLIYVGMMASQDPPRPEVPAAVRTAQEAGIKVCMITGDHILTASAIAREVGILTDDMMADGRKHSMTGSEIEALSDDELADIACDIRVYARVNPEHKIRIVSALKARGQVVAMTGDGVNDAPALKRADIGVAMGVVGTDVTREAADMVLSDDNFSTIVAAVEEGRTVFANLKKVIIYLMASNSSEVMVVALIALFGSSLAALLAGAGSTVAVANLLPLQLLWINLMTDGFPALALGVDPAERDVMARRPRNARKPILSRQRWTQILAQGLVLTVAALLTTFVVAPWMGGLLRPEMPSLADGEALTRTILLMSIAFSQMFFIFIYRSESYSVFSRDSFSNKWLNATFVFTALAQFVVIYVPAFASVFGFVPLNVAEWLSILVMSLLALAAADAIGIFASKRLRAIE